MNPTAIFSKTGKGVQEAAGKTSALSRADRAVLKEIDGKTALANIAVKFEKITADKFDALIQQFDKDGFIREVSSGSQAAAAPPARSAAPAKAAPPPAAGGAEDDMDFTQAIKLPPKAPAAPAAPKPPPVDLAAAARAESDRHAKDQEVFDYKARAEAEAKAKAEAEARARAEGQARAAAEAKARAEAEAKTHTEADAKVKAAREAAVRMATEVKARAEAEGKAKVDAAAGREREALEKARRESEDKARLEAELTGKLEEERRARKELEETAKRDAEQLRQRLEAEMKVKLEEERKAREAEDRKRREEEDRKRAEEDRTRREEDGRRRKEDEERRAKEAAERKAREEEDRKRREEDDRHRKEDEERRAKEVAERRARKEEEERRAKEEADRRAKEEAERRAREEQDRRRRKEEDDRRAKEEAERKAKEEAEVKARSAQSASISAIAPAFPPAPPPAAGDGIGDSLLADLDSFGQREEEEQKAKEEAERKAKEAAARKAKEEAERRAKDDAERRAKQEAENKRRDEEERKAKEEAEQRAREDEERQKQEEAERKAAQRAATAKDVGKGDDDIGVTDDDLDMDDVKKDEKALSATARTAVREREREQAPVAAAAVRRPMKWGKPATIALFVLLVGGVGVLHVMPVSTAEYEKAASDAMGVPVKIASARLSVITGIEVRFEGVSVGDTVKIKLVRGYPEIGSLFGSKKSFSRMELEGASLSQSQLADAVLGKVSGENFRVGRVVIKQAKLDGPLALPALDVEATVSADGSLQSVSLRGGDKLSVQLSPKGNDIGFEISAGSLALPFVPALSLSDFGMKGTANRGGVTMSEFDGRAFDGVISGSAKIRWGADWLVDGEVRARGVKIAVIAPALVSEGKADGRGTYTMSGPNPATLFENARMQGEFKIEKGVLGSFNLTRALQTGGAQTGGRTEFTELTGQAVYDKGTVKVSNVAIAAGAMNAGASLDIDANGGLSGRIVADVKTPNQTLRATLNVSGKIQDPVIRK
ncbi:MAG: hypothetical protein AABM33_10165 [Pseudomonadota bacterium]